ncbi:DnaD domain protein [Levilactobacillus spicheri]|uniref:DNA damage-inducible protein DnaD n=2 Tax=Levilactobacillus spicheri TaxID=216463 RepID=A0ABQ0WSL6_9LACO|nr:DnaD domain protein [Levilactobacillus spicheri]GEO68011.1 DNA damage-inducible protein DnaD [Levilactobacillus spicheri]
MNYLMQIRAFDDYRLYKQKLSAGQVSLWYTLMSINNKAGWSTWFTAANATLESLSGLSRSGIVKNRNVLKQLNLIDFSSNGRKATSYRVCVLYTSDSAQGSIQRSVQDSTQRSTQTSVQGSSALIKQNETKQNETDDDDAGITRANVIDKWTELWGFPNAIAMPEINEWLDALPADVVDFAITIAGEHQVKAAGSLKYMRAVIEGWQKRDISTLDQAKKAAEDHDRRMKSEHSGRKPTPAKETLPTWAQDTPEKPVSDGKLSPEQQAALDARIKKFKARRPEKEGAEA